MRRAVPTAVALVAAVAGAANLSAAVRLEEFDALKSPDGWLPLSASLAGWLVIRLEPRNRIGWLLLAMAVSSATFGGAALIVLGALESPAILYDVAAWLSAWAFLPSYLIAFLLVPLLYPDGHLPSKPWRPLLLVAGGLVIVESLLLAFGSRDSVDAQVANPWQLSAATAVLDVVEPVVWVSMPALAVLGVVSLLQRIAVSSGSTRAQSIVFAATAVIGVVVLLTTGLGVALGLLLPLVVAASVAQTLADQLRRQLALAASQGEDLRASRARITQAHDNARRRIERDLHDGAQQALLALSVGMGRLAGRVGPEMRADAEQLQQLAQRSLVELRQLASGTYPSALRELGVGPALREAVGVGVIVRDEFGDRPRQETEAALYFACLEAVTNARKHAEAFTIDVLLDRTDDGGFRFTVTDDGVGLRGEARGSGVDGMADRLSARGGALDIDSAPGRGTRVTGVAYDVPR